MPEEIGGGGGIFILNFYNIIDKLEKDLIILVMYFLKRIFKVFFFLKSAFVVGKKYKTAIYTVKGNFHERNLNEIRRKYTDVSYLSTSNCEKSRSKYKAYL